MERNQNINSNKEIWIPTHQAINLHDSNPFFRISVDPLHLLKETDLTEIKLPNFDHPIKYYIVKYKSQEYCSLNDGHNTFENKEQKYSYLYHAEKAFELVHYALYKISYFSDQNPLILYENPKLYIDENKPGILTEKRLKMLSNSQKQILLLGITTAIYYLFQKGYTIPDFSLDYVFIEDDIPKIFGYVNYQNLKYNSNINNYYCDMIDEHEIVKRLSLAILEIINSTRLTMNKLLTIPDNITKKLKDLLNFTQDLKNEKLPTLKQLADFFYENNYCKNEIYEEDAQKIFEYQKIIEKTDLIDFNNIKSDSPAISILNNYTISTFFEQTLDQNMYDNIHSLLLGETKNIAAYLWPQIGIFNDPLNYSILNRVPDFVIKNLVQYRPRDSKFLFEMLCYERHDLLLLDFPEDPCEVLKIMRKPFEINSPDDDFKIYQQIIKKASKDTIFNNPKPYFPIAIMHLKNAAKKGHREATILLAKQYFKGKMVPANYQKAISLLSTQLFEKDKKIDQIKSQIQEKLNSIEDAISTLSSEQLDIYNKANREKNPILMIYIAFAFYSGLNGFPKSISHAVYFYREAAKLSPDYMCLLGSLYFRGIIFPRNLKRAQHCFKRAAVGNRYEDGSTGDVSENEPKTNSLQQTQKSKEIKMLATSIISDGKIPKPTVPAKRRLRFSGQFEQYTFGGCIKAKILDNLLRKHLWRSYMNSIDFEFLIQNYLQCPTSLSFDDTMIFPTAVYLSEKTQIPLFYDSPIMKHFFYYDDRNYYKNLKRKEIKLDLLSEQIPYNIIKKIFDNELGEYYNFFKIFEHLKNSNIRINDVNEICFNIEENPNEVQSNKENDDNDDDNKIEKKKANQIEYKNQLQKEFSINDYTSHAVYNFGYKDNKSRLICSSISYFPQISIPTVNEDLLKKSIADASNKINHQTMETETHMNKMNSSVWNEKIMYSAKICLSPEVIKAEEDIENSLIQLKVANCYFDGLNGYPINYKEAARFYKMSADNGNSEAQWKYAQMCANGLGTKQNPLEANEYFKKSVAQKDEDGMFRYALFVRHFLIDSSNVKCFELPSFQQLIQHSADLGNIEAIHQLGICYESNFSGTDEIIKALDTYSQAAEGGHIESLTRLAQLSKSLNEEKQFNKYNKYLMYSVGLFNTELMLKFIEILNKNHEYVQARLIIDVGITIDPDSFNSYFAESIAIFCPYDKPNYKKANEIIDKYLLNYSTETQNNNENIQELSLFEKYVMVKLKILLAQGYDDEAAETLQKYKDCLSKDDFIEFYKKLDKIVAKKYNISISFYSPDYRKIFDAMIKINSDHRVLKKEGIFQLKNIVENNPNNPFALLRLGKLYMKGIPLLFFKNPNKAIDLIQKAAQKDSPEARVTCGKIYFDGYDCEPNTKKAFNYFWKAFDERNRDPRAGYYLSDERFLTLNPKYPNQFTQPEIITKEKALEYLTIAADFGYYKALFKLGKILIIESDPEVAKKGFYMINNASIQGYKEAKKFIKDNPRLFNNIEVDPYDLSDISISV